MREDNNSRIWHVGRDHVGNAVLEWNPETSRVERVEIYEEPEPDLLAGTYNLLERLHCPALAVEDALEFAENPGVDPYDTGSFRSPRL